MAMPMTTTAAAAPAERLKRVLSYTQMEVLRVLLKRAVSDNGLVVASAIADDLGVTRSNAVSALHLAEAAGVLVAVSQGAKGTRIFILDRAALEEAVSS